MGVPAGSVNSTATFAFGHFSTFPSVFPPALQHVLLLKLEGAAWMALRCIFQVQKSKSCRDGFSFLGGKPELGLGFSSSSFPLNQNKTKFLAASAGNHCLCVRKSCGKPPLLHKTEQTHPSVPSTQLSCCVLAGKWHLPGSGIFLQ